MAKKQPSADRIVRLDQIIPSLTATYTDTGVWGLTNGWQNYARFGGTDVPYFQNFIDLAGYTRQDNLTFFMDDRALLDPGVYRSTIDQAGTPAYNFFVEMVTLVTPGPVDPEVVIAEFTESFSPHDGNPGYSDSTLDWRQVILGNNTVLAVDNQVGGKALLTKLRNHYFGSAEPSNNERLYVTKFLVVSGTPPADGDELTIPACRVVLRGMAAEEKDYISVFRLARSYELNQ